MRLTSMKFSSGVLPQIFRNLGFIALIFSQRKYFDIKGKHAYAENEFQKHQNVVKFTKSLKTFVLLKSFKIFSLIIVFENTLEK